jgi:hypothetical protein
MLRRSRHFVVALTLLVTAGCASPVRGRAIALADGGLKVANATSASILDTESAVDGYVESQFLLAPLTGRPEPAGQTLASLDRVRQALNAHASFDAAGQVEQGVNGLIGSVNEYGTVLGHPPANPSGSWVLSKVGGSIAGAKQARELLAASAVIRQSLGRVVDLLRKEKEILASLRSVLVDLRGVTARTLWSLGLGRPGALLGRHVAGFGLSWDEKQLDGVLSLLRKEPSITGVAGKTREDDLRLAIDRVLEHRVSRQASLEGKILDETIAGLEALAVAHGRFEADEDVDLAAVAEQLAAIRTTLDEYEDLSGK